MQQRGPAAFAVDQNNLYWTDYTGGTTVVSMMPKGGGVSPTVLAMGEGLATAIAIDATTVYWTEGPYPDS